MQIVKKITDQSEYSLSKRKNAPKRKRKIILSLIIVILLLGGSWLAWQYLVLKHTTSKIFANGQGISITSIAQAQNTQLAGESSDRTNIMVYGLTADGHRTDTMMLVSYYWKENKVVTLNIPRDLWTSYQGYNGKIVSLYAVAQSYIDCKNKPSADCVGLNFSVKLNGQSYPEGSQSYPPAYVSSFISQEYNIPINYWVVADFNGLVDIVNDVGGITVNNPTAFTDYEYPNANYTGYIRPAPSFSAGEINLDGAEALIYSRSRHSTAANEGTDFARSSRQMQVIQAVLVKLKGQGALSNASQIDKYLQILGNNVYTDMTPAQLISFAGTVNKLDLSKDFLPTDWSTSSGFICDSYVGGQDALEYGVTGDCVAETGVDSQSTYRLQALGYIKNLLTNAESGSQG